MNLNQEKDNLDFIYFWLRIAFKVMMGLHE